MDLMEDFAKWGGACWKNNFVDGPEQEETETTLRKEGPARARYRMMKEAAIDATSYFYAQKDAQWPHGTFPGNFPTEAKKKESNHDLDKLYSDIDSMVAGTNDTFQKGSSAYTMYLTDYHSLGGSSRAAGSSDVKTNISAAAQDPPPPPPDAEKS